MIRELIFNIFCLLCLALCFFLIATPFSQMEVKGKISEYRSIEETVIAMKLQGNKIENVSLNIEVVKANAWLAGAQYWRSTIFRFHWPDEIDSMYPISP